MVADVRTWRKIRSQEGADDSRAAHSPKRGGGGPRGWDLCQHTPAVDDGAGVRGRVPGGAAHRVLTIDRAAGTGFERCRDDSVENHDGPECLVVSSGTSCRSGP